jgi:hypothetical protein
MANVTPLVYDTTYNLSRGCTSADTFAIPGSTLFGGLLKLDNTGTFSGYTVSISMGNISRPAWSTNGGCFSAYPSGTITDNSTAASGTQSLMVTHGFGQGTYAASNAGVVYTNAATMFISGAPVAGANVTITNPYALWINGSAIRFGSTTTTYASLGNGGYLAKWDAGAYINSGPGGGTVQIGSTVASANLLALFNSSGSQEWACDSTGNTTQTGNITCGGAVISNTSSMLVSNTASGGAVLLQVNTGVDIVYKSGQFYCSQDNNCSLGISSDRWTVVYAVTGTINTSDATEKTPLRALTDAEISAGTEIANNIGVYQWLDAIAKKGADKARLHTGVIAQQVQDTFTKYGLDAHRYGLFCYDQWDAVDAATETDEEGNTRTVMPAVTAGERYGVRYDELHSFLCACFHQRLLKLEAALAA